MPQRESDLAENLIDKMLSVEFEPEKYHNEYRERVLAMIDQRAKGDYFGATRAGAPWQKSLLFSQR